MYLVQRMSLCVFWEQARGQASLFHKVNLLGNWYSTPEPQGLGINT